MAKQQRSSTLINRFNGKRIKLNGYRPSNGNKPPRFQKYGATRFQDNQLPPRVDLRPYMTQVENQSALNSCVANAMAGAYEYLAKRALGTAGDVSRLFVYYNARQYEGSLEDAGCMIASAIRVLQEHGACNETTWAYDEVRVNECPSDDAYAEAKNFLVEEADELDTDLHAMKHCLAEGFPFAFGLRLFHSFDKAAKRGIVPMSAKDEEGRAEHGWHAMLCVGYSDQSKAFIVRNSWGEDWGDRGYCYVPYDYMTNSDYCQECWAVRAVSDLDFSRGVWVEEDFSIVDTILDIFSTEEDEESVYDYEYEEDEDEGDEEVVEDSYEEENEEGEEDGEEVEDSYEEDEEGEEDEEEESYEEEVEDSYEEDEEGEEDEEEESYEEDEEE